MSRFFTTGSDSESESSVSGDELVPKAPGGNYGKPLLLSEDEEDTKRVVRSAKDKRSEEHTNVTKMIKDLMQCLEELERSGWAFGKAKSVVDKEVVSHFLANLQDYLNELQEDKEGKKKMNNAKALSTLRQICEYNWDFETHIPAYRQNCSTPRLRPFCCLPAPLPRTADVILSAQLCPSPTQQGVMEVAAPPVGGGVGGLLLLLLLIAFLAKRGFFRRNRQEQLDLEMGEGQGP